MGGGDLNTKKTWHPSTLKNQERVWKAEQAAAEEKKRIIELERERAQERDREELNALAKQNLLSASESNDNRLHWMYDKPDKKSHQEDYLLGKAIDKNYDQPSTSDQHEIPAVSRRVVGSSMITSAGDVQVDLVRKLREDPLLLVKERERAARAALLNNPVQRKKLTELLRKEQEQKNLHKSEKKSKKKDNSLDNLLAAKLNALGGEKGMDIAKLLESDSSSDSSSEEEIKKKKKKKKKNKKQKTKKRNDDIGDDLLENNKKSRDNEGYKKKQNKNDDSETEQEGKKYSTKYKNSKNVSSLKRKSTDSGDDESYSHKRSRRDNSPYMKRGERNKTQDSSKDRNMREDRKKYSYENRQTRYEESERREKLDKKKKGLSEEEKAARLEAMAAAGAEREVQRGRRVAEQRAEIAIAEKTISRHSSRNEARVLPDSLESRIHSNRHYIQRDKRHMNEHFARR